MKENEAPPYRWSDLFESVLIALLLALFIRTFFISAYKIPTSAMAPTLRSGDFVLANKVPFGFKIPFTQIRWGGRAPERGELIIFHYPNKPNVSYLKRVVGISGDHIEIKNKQVFVNESLLGQTAENPDLVKGIPGADYLKVFSEDNGISKYLVMYSDAADAQNLGPFVVPPNEIFVIGDNRDASDDSRYWGTVPISNVEARAEFIWLSLDWSASNKSPTLRADRLFKNLH